MEVPELLDTISRIASSARSNLYSGHRTDADSIVYCEALYLLRLIRIDPEPYKELLSMTEDQLVEYLKNSNHTSSAPS